MEIIVSNELKEDITQIYKYIAKDSVKYANETINNIYMRISELKRTLYIGRYITEIPNKKYREIVYKSYRIIYTISEESNKLYIHFIIHSKRNFKSFFDTYNSKKQF